MNRNPSSAGWWIAATLACLSVPGCSSAGAGSDGRPGYPVSLVCTTGQVADILRHVGGEHVVVESLMGAGVDPHLYKATPGDVRKLNAADAVFYSGLHLEGRLADLLEKLARRKPVYAVTEELERLHQDELSQQGTPLLREVPGSEGHYDPHVWFDVSLWAKCVDNVAEKLIKLDGDRGADYRRNADAYIARLMELHQSCREQLAEVPQPRRVMITAHDAFGYFGRAYDVEVHGLQGISTSDEADLANTNHLVEMLVARKIKAVFVETSLPTRHVRSLVEACGVRGHTVTVGRELFSDAMGPQGTDEGTYVGMIQYNVKTIVEALK